MSLPVGPPVPGWSPRPFPEPLELVGRWVRLAPLDPGHAAALHDEVAGPGREPLWTYLAEEMPDSPSAFAAYVDRRLSLPATSTLSVVPLVGEAADRPAGLASWMRVDTRNGTVEVGSILLGPALQRTTAATEAMWLMARHVFGLGYRRYEWKCDSLHAGSRAAALRLGFRHEGTHSRAVVYKGRSRDTAWFSMTQEDWAALAPAYRRWLDPDNFSDPRRGTGQRVAMSSLTAAALASPPRDETTISQDETAEGPG